jgi:AcrR family transcriptional regulator
VTTSHTGLRERKKQATRKALREAALRLALERGLDNVRVDDIAEAAGVAPRTYNNYFSSREQAIVAAVTAEREARVAAAVAARPASVRLADAVIGAIVEQYASPGEHGRDALLLITTRPALRDAFAGTASAIEHPLADVIAGRLGDADWYTARVLAASVAAAVHVALERWVQPVAASPAAGGLVVPSGSLPDLLHTALAPLAPALAAAEERPQRGQFR